MNGFGLRRSLACLAITLVFSGLAFAAPEFNEAGTPPRSVFLRLPDGQPVPQVQLEVRELANGTWRMEIAATHFVFTDVCVSTAEALPVGHAHVLKDGTKIGSAYLPIFDLGALPPGTHHFVVILRGQDHRPLVSGNALVKASIMFSVPAKTADGLAL